jgi:hypothetical protein
MGMNKKTPAYAVLTTFLNLLKKWVPNIVASGFLLPAFAGYQQTCTPQTRQGPRFQGVGSKNEC